MVSGSYLDDQCLERAPTRSKVGNRAVAAAAQNGKTYANSISILSCACISCEVTCHVSRVSCIVNLTIISNNNLIQTACTVSFQGGGVKSPFLPQEAKKQSKTVSKIFPLSMKRCWHYFVAIKGGEEGPLPAPPSRCHC